MMVTLKLVVGVRLDTCIQYSDQTSLHFLCILYHSYLGTEEMIGTLSIAQRLISCWVPKCEWHSIIKKYVFCGPLLNIPSLFCVGDMPSLFYFLPYLKQHCVLFLGSLLILDL